MNPEQTQELTYILLIELLAGETKKYRHQFAFPVKWIETQTQILETQDAERIIEIGPSSTLTDMMQKTLGASHQERDDARGVKRQLLCYGKNGGDIYYTYTGEEQESKEQEVDRLPTSAVDHRPRHESPILADHLESPGRVVNIKSQVDSGDQVEKDDGIAQETPGRRVFNDVLTARGVIHALLSPKLNRNGKEFRWESCIKELSGGKSTLQNEIIGDLVEEFGGLPPNAEDVPVEEIEQAVRSNFKGRLGKVSEKLVAKVAASKFPPEYNTIAKVRKYIHGRWGVGSGEYQDSILLKVLTRPPEYRLTSPDKADIFMDRSFPQFSLGDRDSRDAALDNSRRKILDVGAVNRLEKKKLKISRKLLQAHTDDAGFNVHRERAALTDSVKRAANLQQRLDEWVGEHGEVYESGMASIFRPSMIRTYDSGWHWARLRSWRADTKLDEHIHFNEGDSPPRKNGLVNGRRHHPKESPCCRQILTKKRGRWKQINRATLALEATLQDFGASLPLVSGKTVLLTGAGPGSIGYHLLELLMAGGARVVVTTSGQLSEAAQIFSKLYKRFSSEPARLVLVPFNQGSSRDVEALTQYIYDPKNLGWDLDAIIPFAAIAERDRSIQDVDSRSELAHRVMLTNTIRLLGAVVRQKSARGINSRPAQVILPLSPNNGTFGNDGLYAESKLGLEAMFEKWASEGWQDYLSICGVKIGWTRGTGLMRQNDGIVDAMEEELGISTFSPEQMAKLIFCLTTPRLVDICEELPLMADFAGRVDKVSNLSARIKKIRSQLREEERQQHFLALEAQIDRKAISGDQGPEEDGPRRLAPRSNLKFSNKSFEPYNRLFPRADPKIAEMVELDSTVVIAGFAEIGPYGSSRTRWEMEKNGVLSLEGIVELAWMMGLIKYDQRTGWKDAESGEVVEDHDMRDKYEASILENSGLRFVERSSSDLPSAKTTHEITIEEDMEPFFVSEETAGRFKQELGDLVQIYRASEGSEWEIQIKKGAKLSVPLSVSGEFVGGQIPRGWNPTTYGLTPDIISQVDPIILQVLVCAMEAILSSGVTDFYEFYKHIHTSDVAICIGSGTGGIESLVRLVRDQFGGESSENVQSDVLQETFINTASAWVNMLLLSANGPIRTPVGACATAAEALDSGVDLILRGKAKVCLVGGFDDLRDEWSVGFRKMSATADVEKELARGRPPREMSRPLTSSRSGFLEAQGAGLQLITSAGLAIEMGLPIHGVVAFSGTAGDKAGRSIPSAGQGIASFAAEQQRQFRSQSLNVDYRYRQFRSRVAQVEETYLDELFYAKEEVSRIGLTDAKDVSTLIASHREQAEFNRTQSLRQAREAFSIQFWLSDPSISPIRGSLAAWGLTVDDINAAVLHATSTVQGDLNEIQTLHTQLSHLNRKKENLLPVVCQKYLTGHGKGASAAWALNCALQILDSGVVPGNPNADNIDASLREFQTIVIPDERNISTIRGRGGKEEAAINAISVTSFGFGQKGTQTLIVHPKLLLSTVGETRYEMYAEKARRRQQLANRYWCNGIFGRDTLFKAKDKAPFVGETEKQALLDKSMRL